MEQLMTSAEHIKTTAERYLGEDYFVVDVKISKGNPPKIKIIVDGIKGVTIDDCSQLSRNLQGDLESTFENFSLEVTTPGLDQPLVMKRQYQKNIGRQIKIILEDQEIIQGQLKGYNDTCVELLLHDKKKNIKACKQISFSEIRKSFVQISFNQ